MSEHSNLYNESMKITLESFYSTFTFFLNNLLKFSVTKNGF